MAKNKNTTPAPIVENKVGIRAGINAAKNQCVVLPKD